jgi:cyclopropane fatty-acyl-phospholipid synthase-like methyltransferase
LSSTAIQYGTKEYPRLRLIAADFIDAQLDGPFDEIVSSDVVAHVADQQAYIKRAHDLLQPGGIFFLMS